MFELEKRLQSAQRKSGNKFPASHKYFDLYISAKKWLSDNVFKTAIVTVACNGEGFYTDHGIDHFNAIIGMADYFFKSITRDPLTDYEVYLFLMSALMHDAGMAYGRKYHGKNCRAVALDMQNCLPSSEFERRTIFSIAEAHQGKTVSGSCDTLGVLEISSELRGVSFRPALLAAFLRFFDEVSETKERAALYHLNNGILPEESKIHHAYAKMINSVRYSNGVVTIVYGAMKQDLLEKFDVFEGGRLVESVYIFDWVCRKLKKINNERQYCSRFMWGVLRLESIQAEFTIFDDILEECKKIFIRCNDRVNMKKYASDKIEIAPKYSGEKLFKEFN